MRFWAQIRSLVEIEILIFSDTYISLEYTCEILVLYLKRFLRNRQQFIGPYVMELYVKCLRRQCEFSDRQLGEFISGCLKRIDYSFGKVHFTSEILN